MYDHLGISICFRGQASEVVAENTTNQIEPKIRKIGLGVNFQILDTDSNARTKYEYNM